MYVCNIIKHMRDTSDIIIGKKGRFPLGALSDDGFGALNNIPKVPHEIPVYNRGPRFRMKNK